MGTPLVDSAIICYRSDQFRLRDLSLTTAFGQPTPVVAEHPRDEDMITTNLAEIDDVVAAQRDAPVVRTILTTGQSSH